MDIEKNNVPMDWDDIIEQDGQDYIVLEEGDYNFLVMELERGRFPGSLKIPPCNKATISAIIHTEAGRATVKFDLILCRSLEWKLAAFFRCMGQKKRDEPLKMDWTRLVGHSGRAHFKPRTYIDKSGEERSVNDIEYFIDYDPAFFKDADPQPDNQDLPF